MTPCPVFHTNGEQCAREAGHEGNHRLPNAHRCHATGCTRQVKPELLMCFAHWNRVPRKIQRAVWANYRPGQCDDKAPSEKWHDAADAAIGAVAQKEGRPLSQNQREALAWFTETLT
jgi:hypothetical protein